MNEGYKCKNCSNCLYCERVTSYGTEEIRCGNYDCVHYGTEYMEVNDEEGSEDEYIEKDEAIRRIEVRRKITCESDPYNYEDWTKGYEEGIDDAIAMINSVPSVTPIRPHGHNENNDYADCDQFVCSECGIELQDWHRIERDIDDGDITYREYTFRYCPNCGAKMEWR